MGSQVATLSFSLRGKQLGFLGEFVSAFLLGKMDFQKESKQTGDTLLQFQDFGTTSNDSKPPPFEGSHNFDSFPTSHIDIENDQGAEKEADGSPVAEYSMLSWGYYQRYFDVDTPQVKERLMWSFIPRPAKDTLTNFIRPSPDLYGPFWVCVTLIFCIAIMEILLITFTPAVKANTGAMTSVKSRFLQRQFSATRCCCPCFCGYSCGGARTKETNFLLAL